MGRANSRKPLSRLIFVTLKGRRLPPPRDGEAAESRPFLKMDMRFSTWLPGPGGRILDRLLLARPRVSGPPCRVGDFSLAPRHGVAVESRACDEFHKVQWIDVV